MSNFLSFLTTAAEIVGLLMVAVISVKAYKHLFHARVLIEFLPPSTETYVQTPGIVGNRNSANSGARPLSHSKFRIKLQVTTSRKIQLHGAALYAYHREMARQWAELSPITLPVLSDEAEVHQSVEEFVKANSKPCVAGSVIVDNGTENYKIELGAGESREMVIARLGGFILPLPERSRTINGTNYCDVLLRLNINAVAAAFLVCLPRHNADGERGPIVADFKIFHRAKTIDVLTWATRVRPQPGAEGGRRAEKFWVKLLK